MDIYCSECETACSETTAKCPNCGHRLKSRAYLLGATLCRVRKRWWGGFLLVCAVGLAFLWAGRAPTEEAAAPIPVVDMHVYDVSELISLDDVDNEKLVAISAGFWEIGRRSSSAERAKITREIVWRAEPVVRELRAAYQSRVGKLFRADRCRVLDVLDGGKVVAEMSWGGLRREAIRIVARSEDATLDVLSLHRNDHINMVVRVEALSPWIQLGPRYAPRRGIPDRQRPNTIVGYRTKPEVPEFRVMSERWHSVRGVIVEAKVRRRSPSSGELLRMEARGG